jgi:hypothetical protein
MPLSGASDCKGANPALSDICRERELLVRNGCAGLRRYPHLRGEKDLAITATPREKTVRFPAVDRPAFVALLPPCYKSGWKGPLPRRPRVQRGPFSADLAKRTHFGGQLNEKNGPVFFRSNPETIPIEPMPQPGSPPGQWQWDTRRALWGRLKTCGPDFIRSCEQ